MEAPRRYEPGIPSPDRALSVGQTDDDACGKLWDVYLGEAQRYDESLVKSWKEDMDVTLVFSGLYSAVLTAFVIENYKNMKADPSETSAALLEQILVQLADGKVSSTGIPFSTEFSLSPYALASNVLWFLSLTLALLCAFLATFVQQWTRQFLHRTTILRSSTARARLFSFLYFGLKDCHMHAVVDIIPSLLHSSLFCFFAGLVAFLHEVNAIVTWLMAAALILITLVYSIFTIFPVLKLNSTYQTPLSPVVWRLWCTCKDALRSVTSAFQPRPVLPTSTPITRSTSIPNSITDEKQPRTLTDAMVVASRHDGEAREAKSITWTIRSLNDDSELLPFIESIPDMIYGPEGLRINNFHLIRPLLETSDPHIDIISRTLSLISNADNPWFSAKHKQRCRSACPRVLWTLAYMLLRHPDSFALRKTGKASWFPEYTWVALENAMACDAVDSACAVSASTLCTLISIHSHSQRHVAYSSLMSSELLTHYLQKALDALPYQFELTCSLIDIEKPIRTSPIVDEMCKRLDQSVADGSLTSKAADLDRIFALLFMTCDLPEASHLLRYIAKRVNIGGWTTTYRLWLRPRLRRLYDLASVHDVFEDNYCDTLKEVLFGLGPKWTGAGDAMPFWDDALRSLHSKNAKTPSATSLMYMVELLGLKPVANSKPPAPVNQRLSRIVLDTLSNDSELTTQDRTGDATHLFTHSIFRIICRALKHFDVKVYSDALATRDALEYVYCIDLDPILAQSITPELAVELANCTKALSGVWRSQDSYREGDARQEVVILVWQLWVPFLERADPAIDPALPILREAADIIERFEFTKAAYKGKVWIDDFEKDWKPRSGTYRPFDYRQINLKNQVERLKPLMVRKPTETA